MDLLWIVILSSMISKVKRGYDLILRMFKGIVMILTKCFFQAPVFTRGLSVSFYSLRDTYGLAIHQYVNVLLLKSRVTQLDKIELSLSYLLILVTESL